MDKEKIITAISQQLEDITEQFEIIREYEGKIPKIELDLLLSNIRNVYESLLVLDKANQPVIDFNVEISKGEEEKGRKGEREKVKVPEHFKPVSEEKVEPEPEPEEHTFTPPPIVIENEEEEMRRKEEEEMKKKEEEEEEMRKKEGEEEMR